MCRGRRESGRAGPGCPRGHKSRPQDGRARKDLALDRPPPPRAAAPMRLTQVWGPGAFLGLTAQCPGSESGPRLGVCGAPGGAAGVPASLSLISVSSVPRAVASCRDGPLRPPPPHDGHHPPPLQRSLAPFCARAAGIWHLPGVPGHQCVKGLAPHPPGSPPLPGWFRPGPFLALSTLGNQTVSPRCS